MAVGLSVIYVFQYQTYNNYKFNLFFHLNTCHCIKCVFEQHISPNTSFNVDRFIHESSIIYMHTNAHCSFDKNYKISVGSESLTLFRPGSERFDSGRVGGLFGPPSDIENHTSEPQTANSI